MKKEPEQYRLLRDFMDHVPDVIYFKDKKGRFVLVNRAHAKGLGLKPEEVIGKTDFDIFPRERAKLMERDDRKVMTTGKPIIDKVERATRPDGVDNYVSTTKIPRFDEKGRVIGLVGITRDITHRMQIKRLEEERARIGKKLEVLEELNKLESGFISAVSHELRTPLAIIKEAIGVVIDGLAGPVNSQQKDFLNRAGNNIGRLKNLIDDLLDISRIETGRLRLHYSLVNLNDLIVDSADHFRRLAFDKGVKLQYQLPKKEINIFVDAERTVQIVNNLIDNALKFTEEKGEVRVRVDILEDKVRVAVFDTGVGIGKEDLPKLFNRFVQVSRVAGAGKKGVGLGLSIVKELVHKHGGEIWVESKSGVGSRFYFTLPRIHSVNILNGDTRDRVNNLLNDGKRVYLINLLVINSREIKIDTLKLINDLKNIVEQAFRLVASTGEGGFRINSADTRRAEFSVIFPDATDKKVSLAVDFLKEKIRDYFIKNRVMNLFVNIGKFPYVEKEEDAGNFHIKNVHIGFEKRNFKRVDCNGDMEICFSDRSIGLSVQTVDISQGGICFLSKGQLKTNKLIEVKLRSSKSKAPVSFKARVAWIKPIEESRGKVNKYKIGAEFSGIKGKSKKELLRLIKSLSSLNKRLKL
ncbi:MAG: ATP-binding protein [Candidatus Omnitrophica bacterium]|nr:ATP-binding protein [Candidatus Omnitrophota bacterium]